METFEVDSELYQCNEIECLNRSLETLYESVKNNGVNKGLITEVFCLLETEDDVNLIPINSYTKELSEQNKEVALEVIMSGILKGLKRILDWLVKAVNKVIENLRKLLQALINRATKSTDETKEEDAIIGAVSTGKKEYRSTLGITSNTINDKPVSIAVIEDLLTTAPADERGGQYKSIRDILYSFFPNDKVDIVVDDIIKNPNNSLATMTEYIRNWWNTSHPLLMSHSDLTETLVSDILETLDKIYGNTERVLNWWKEKIEEFSKASEDDLLELIKTTRKIAKDDLTQTKTEITVELNKTFSKIPFIEESITDDLTGSSMKLASEFSKYKVKTKDKLNLLKALEEIRWLSEIKDFSNRLNRSQSELKKLDNILEVMISDITREGINANLNVGDSNELIKDIKGGIHVYLLTSLSLTSLLTFIDNGIKLNRKKFAGLYRMLLSLGVEIQNAPS